MNTEFPSNLLPYLIGFPVFLLFGLRGMRNYRRLHNPLSLYFAWSGFTAGLSFFFFSTPFAFTNAEIPMTIFSIIGDFFLYAMFVLQAALLHYLTLKGRVSLSVLLTPAIVLAITGWVTHIYGYIHYGVSVTNKLFEYQLPLYASIAQTALLVVVLLVGVVLLSKFSQQSNTRGKAGLLSIGLLYILSAVGGALNVLLSGKPNDSPIIITSYIGGFVLFVGILIAVRLLRQKTS
jgi:hypothetical protein